MKKYRVWCKDKNQWESDITFLRGDGKLLQLNKNGLLQPLKEETHIIQFSTGLIDKNGKEIYDGDIIKSDVELRNVFYPEYIGFVSINLEISGKITIENKNRLTSDKNLLQILSKVEIIGNVYEDAELLK